jgi:hypothetical protein
MNTILTVIAWLAIGVVAVYVAIHLAIIGINAISEFGDEYE